MGSHSRGPHSRGAAPNTLKPLCLEDLLSDPFARGPSFVGAPHFVGALCNGTCGTCLNTALI
jgi:hypothetical protein